MKSRRFASSSAFLLGLCPAACVAWGSNEGITARSDSDARWEVHAGFGIRQSFDLRVASASRDLTGGLYAPSSGSSAVLGSVGPANAEANRVYDDGFVKIGSSYNLTTNWGYSSASQVGQSSQPWNPSQPWDSPGNRSLYLTKTSVPGVGAFQSSDDTDEGFFPYVEVHRLWKNDPDSFWDEKGVAAFWSWIPTTAGLADQLGMLQTRVVDEYYLYGVIPPAAPYSGPALPPGPLLDNIPHNRVEDSSATGLLGATFTDLDLDLHTVSFGGIWRHETGTGAMIDDQLRLHGLDLQAGLSLNYARLEMDSSTTVYSGSTVIGTYRDHGSRSEMLPGLYASLGATLDIGEREEWMMFTQARYDYAGDIEVHTGNSSAEVDLKGLSWTIGIGKRW